MGTLVREGMRVTIRIDAEGGDPYRMNPYNLQIATSGAKYAAFQRTTPRGGFDHAVVIFFTYLSQQDSDALLRELEKFVEDNVAGVRRASASNVAFGSWPGKYEPAVDYVPYLMWGITAIIGWRVFRAIFPDVEIPYPKAHVSVATKSGHAARRARRRGKLGSFSMADIEVWGKRHPSEAKKVFGKLFPTKSTSTPASRTVTSIPATPRAQESIFSQTVWPEDKGSTQVGDSEGW